MKCKKKAVLRTLTISDDNEDVGNYNDDDDDYHNTADNEDDSDDGHCDIL